MKKPTTTLEVTINRDTIVSVVAAYLHAARLVPDSDNITNIQFGELFGVSDTEHVPLKIFYKPQVRLIKH